MKPIRPLVLAMSLALAGPVFGQHGAETIVFSIPRTRLPDALSQWSKATGLQVFSDAAVVRTLTGNPVVGSYTSMDALRLLLEDTDLTFDQVSEQMIAIKERKPKSVVERTALPLTPLAMELPSKQTMQVASASSATEASETGSRASARSDASIETVMVTAQRRAERLIDVPLSMSVLGIDEVERRGLVSREDYLRSIPSVSVRDDGVGMAEIVIRGAYGDSFRTGPTVGLYFGDVPLSGYAIGGSADVKLIDMARVEVLRGPQGTLYGSNALSGAVRYIAAEPDLRDFTGNVRVGYSNTARHGGSNNSIDGVLNVPLVTDKLAIRAVAFRHFNEGYVRNNAGSDPAMQAAASASGATGLAINKDHVGDTEYVGGRVSALWQPTDGLAINLTYVKQRDSQDDRLFELRQSGPYQRSDYQLGAVVGGSDDAQRIDLDILNLTATYDFSFGTLYSSSAWMEQDFIRKWDIGSLTSIFGTPLKPISQMSTTNADVFAQEVRFTSKFDGPFQVVTGLYYEDSGQPTQQPTFYAGDPSVNPYAAIKLWEIDLERDVKQKAVYGELSYALVEQVKLTVGGRYFDYDSRFSTNTFDTVILAPSFSDTKASESGETFKAGVEYKPTDETLVYATWSQGFRLGRPLATEFIRAVCDRNQDGLIDNTAISSNLNRVDSDRLDSYEIGAKLGFMEGRGMLSTAVYQNNWSDIPVVFQPPGCSTTLTINGGHARARGLEGEANFRVLDTVKLSLGVGYVKSELTSTTSLGRAGDELNFTPELNGNFGVEYGFGVAQRDGFVRADYTYFGSYYTQTGHRGVKADAYGLVNLHGGLAITDSSEVLINVDNLLNADDYTTVVGPSGFPPGYSVRLRPRTIGLGLTYRF